MTTDSKRILIATFPFGTTGNKPLELLHKTGWELVFNPHHRRLTAQDVSDLLPGIDAVIAGTEPYNAETLATADRLKVISRVGIGLDSVDLGYCSESDIAVTYTPDAPSDGVAELTVANILNLLRHIHASDRSVREGAWNRLMGHLVRDVAIGVVGVGRIGSRVIRLLEPFGARILATDTDPTVHGQPLPNTEWCDLESILSKADLISFHIPMNEENHHFVNRDRIAAMKTGAMIINTARGGIADTEALTDALLQRHLGGAALDVYEKEPYVGPLSQLDNVILTAHIAASAKGSRYLMELGAAEDCIRVLSGASPANNALYEVLSQRH
ncbi:MAG: phosphoglycerate dehydrogenase [Kiritimatiellia bacterium]|nr:phosphoglycerate dehydrogenase [Kiritimatiellia bacterium]MDP6809660.1 phosphoglycerate dehydrogenase [Kiritimatiellia bacterium]MDP7023490.1 phosphoglycerate dehydrogenase [Kiritimatiellia bacterium]